jgi:hypothetical protein
MTWVDLLDNWFYSILSWNTWSLVWSFKEFTWSTVNELTNQKYAILEWITSTGAYILSNSNEIANIDADSWEILAKKSWNLRLISYIDIDWKKYYSNEFYTNVYDNYILNKSSVWNFNFNISSIENVVFN